MAAILSWRVGAGTFAIWCMPSLGYKDFRGHKTQLFQIAVAVICLMLHDKQVMGGIQDQQLWCTHSQEDSSCVTFVVWRMPEVMSKSCCSLKDCMNMSLRYDYLCSWLTLMTEPICCLIKLAAKFP